MWIYGKYWPNANKTRVLKDLVRRGFRIQLINHLNLRNDARPVSENSQFVNHDFQWFAFTMKIAK